MAHCESIGHAVLILMAIGLGLTPEYFIRSMCKDPLCLFRIFHYPPGKDLPEKLRSDNLWGVGEHTDYGLITLLKQDDVGGLQVKTITGEWLDATHIPRTLVINVGDMLEAITSGLFVSTPHRVKNSTDRMRLSFPFFFDPGLHATIEKIHLSEELLGKAKAQVEWRRSQPGLQRWDAAGEFAVNNVEGRTYGEYLLRKVGKVFPDLAMNNL